MGAVPVRRLPLILAGALTGLLACAALAGASVYGHLPKTGRWHGSDPAGASISFTVTKHGHVVKGFTVNTTYSCTMTDQDNDEVPSGGGPLTLTDPSPEPVDPDFGYMKDIYLKTTVPGDSTPVIFRITAGFTSHRSGGPGITGEGEVAGGFNKDDGENCQLPGDDWKGKPHG